jgi:hypothetical protein
MRLLSVGQSLVIPDREGARYKFRQQSFPPKFGRKSTPAPVAVKSISQQHHPKAALISPVKKPTRSSGLTSVALESEGSRRNYVADFSRTSSPATFVQGPLLLEKVRVARNDLSETDLEIVPAQTKAPIGGGKLTAKRPRHQWWRWICLQNASRLINAARALF